jgi:hypothetical protein
VRGRPHSSSEPLTADLNRYPSGDNPTRRLPSPARRTSIPQAPSRARSERSDPCGGSAPRAIPSIPCIAMSAKIAPGDNRSASTRASPSSTEAMTSKSTRSNAQVFRRFGVVLGQQHSREIQGVHHPPASSLRCCGRRESRSSGGEARKNYGGSITLRADVWTVSSEPITAAVARGVGRKNLALFLPFGRHNSPQVSANGGLSTPVENLTVPPGENLTDRRQRLRVSARRANFSR